MNFIYRLLLTFNATSLIIVVFLIKEKFVFSCIWSKFIHISNNEVSVSILKILKSFPDFISYIVYILIPILFTFISLRVGKHLGNANISKGTIVEIENANNAFLPSYLGYFFVALSISTFDTLVYMFIILFVFTFLSQTLYFNPLFLIFGYHFYNVSTSNKAKLFIISKKEIIKVDDVEFPLLKRINNFTFIEYELPTSQEKEN